MTKPRERQLARELRRDGPYKRIAARLGVSPASVVTWTRDITLSEDQHSENRRGRGGPWHAEDICRRAAAWAERCRVRRAAWQEEGRSRARAGDPLHLAGCMLYWAEGTKGRNAIKLEYAGFDEPAWLR